MTRLIMAIPLLIAPTIAANSQASRDANVKPKEGFVPDAKTAEKIAKAVLVPVYGEKQIRQESFKAIRRGNIWTVTGTLNCGAPNCDGGTAVVEISKTSGEILSMVHYK
jgi:NTF2 fold immunity protein